MLEAFKPLIARLDCFLVAMPHERVMLFRGLASVRTARWYRIGGQQRYAAFTSLSAEDLVAWEFAGGDGGTRAHPVVSLTW